MLGEQIKELRQSHKMNQVELAKDLNVTKQSISNWENNNILPSVEMLRKIAIYFSCSTDYLLEMNNSSITLDLTELTLEQNAKVQELVKDYKRLNEYEKYFHTKKAPTPISKD
ncbi:MAG: helix-turn-helix transcriptional regulator [Eubacteriales bacterium]